MLLEASEIFRVLGVETRIRIIEILKEEGPLGVKRLSEMLGITPAAVSQHLKVLRHAGLVTCERKGYWIPYSLDPEALQGCRAVMDKVCACRGHHRHGHRENMPSDLDELKTYEQELRAELQRVQAEIAGMQDPEE